MSTPLYPPGNVPIVLDQSAGWPKVAKLTIYSLQYMRYTLFWLTSSQPNYWMTDGNNNNAVEGEHSFIGHIIFTTL